MPRAQRARIERRNKQLLIINIINANNLHQVIENPIKTTLTAFFELCSHDDFEKTLFYHVVPSHYTWDDSRG